MKIKEGIEGCWHYHIAKDNEYTSLCGKKVMNTEIPFNRWGIGSPHIPERWCKECYSRAILECLNNV